MTDQQIVPGAGPTPVAIVLDTAQLLLPKLAFASFDGSGAAGDFLPVIKFVGPGGLVAGQAVGDVVTAGASVDQTWFRGLTKKTAGGTALSVATETVAHGAVTIHGFGVEVKVPWGYFSGAHLLDYSVPFAPTVLADGIYALTVEVVMATAVFNKPSVMAVQLAVGDGPIYNFRGACVLATNVVSSTSGVQPATVLVSTPPVHLSAGETAGIAFVAQGSGGDLAFALNAVVSKLN